MSCFGEVRSVRKQYLYARVRGEKVQPTVVP